MSLFLPQLFGMQSACSIFYCHLWPVWLYRNFLYIYIYLLNNTIFGSKNLLDLKMYFDFLYSFSLQYFSFWEYFSRILSYMLLGLHIKYPLFLSDFNQTGISRQILRIILKCQISWKCVLWNPICSCGQTDRQTWRSLYLLFANLRTHLKRECIVAKIFVAVVKCSTKRNPLFG